MKSLFVLIFVGLLRLSDAHTFIVGGEDGWTLKPSENYNHWSERYRFLVQDQLVFKYEKGLDSVFVVEKDDYVKCNKDEPIKSLKNQKGQSKFEFNRSGPFYFISGHEQNCENGQKLMVVVLSTHHGHRNTTAPVLSPPPPKTSSPIKPPSPSPSGDDHRSKSPSPSPVSNRPGPNSSPSHSPSISTSCSKSPSPSPSSSTQHWLRSPSPSPSHPKSPIAPSPSTTQHPSKSPSPSQSVTDHHVVSPTSQSPTAQSHSKNPISPSDPNSPSPNNARDVAAPQPSLQLRGSSPLRSPAPARSSDAPSGFRVSFLGLKESAFVMLVASAFIV